MLHLKTESASCEEITQATCEIQDKEVEVPGLTLNNDDLRKISVRNDIFQPKDLFSDYSTNKQLKEFKDKFPEKIKCDQCKRWITYKSSWDIHRRYVCRGRKSSVPTDSDAKEVAQVSINNKSSGSLK